MTTKKSDTKKKSAKVLEAEKKAEQEMKELKARVKLSAGNAEKAYVIMDEVEYKGRSFYDISFATIDPMSIFSKEEQTEYIDLINKYRLDSEKGIDIPENMDMELLKRFPKLASIQTNKGFLINKVLNMNGKVAKELAELYIDNPEMDHREAVGFAKSYISFLDDLQK